jgi:hypothetical protein
VLKLLMAHSSSEQDAGLDTLVQAIARQKQLGMRIGDELGDQNSWCTPVLWFLIVSDMLSDLREGMDNTHVRLKRETKHTEYITEKTKTGSMLQTRSSTHMPRYDLLYRSSYYWHYCCSGASNLVRWHILCIFVCNK